MHQHRGRWNEINRMDEVKRRSWWNETYSREKCVYPQGKLVYPSILPLWNANLEPKQYRWSHLRICTSESIRWSLCSQFEAILNPKQTGEFDLCLLLFFPTTSIRLAHTELWIGIEYWNKVLLFGVVLKEKVFKPQSIFRNHVYGLSST